MSEIGSQLQLLGLEETRRTAVAGVTKPRQRARILDQVEVTHELLSAMPSAEDLSFLHNGLCQTCLPHSRPAKNTAIWRRHSGRFTLIVTPGLIDSSALETRSRQPTEAETEAMYVGVPFGTKARLILTHLQMEGLKNRMVPLGASLFAFMRSLGLGVQGGNGEVSPPSASSASGSPAQISSCSGRKVRSSSCPTQRLWMAGTLGNERGWGLGRHDRAVVQIPRTPEGACRPAGQTGDFEALPQ